MYTDDFIIQCKLNSNVFIKNQFVIYVVMMQNINVEALLSTIKN